MSNVWNLPVERWYKLGSDINAYWKNNPDHKEGFLEGLAKETGIDRVQLYEVARIAERIPLDLITKYPNVQYAHWRALSRIEHDRFNVIPLLAHRVHWGGGRITARDVAEDAEEYQKSCVLIASAEKFNAKQLVPPGPDDQVVPVA